MTNFRRAACIKKYINDKTGLDVDVEKIFSDLKAKNTVKDPVGHGGVINIDDINNVHDEFFEPVATRLRREADKTADMVEMEESEQVGVGAGAGEGQNKDVVLNPIQKKPVGRDVAVARSLQVAGKRMVVVLRGKRFAFCKHLDDCGKLGAIRTALEHLLQFLAELLGLADCVFHEKRNSSSLLMSVQDGALGSCAMRFAFSIASSVSSRGVFLRPSLKGISPASI